MNNIVCFWKPFEDNGIFSNWYYCKFTDEHGIQFENSEQYMMYYKAQLFNDISTANKILKVSDPKIIKELGRQVKNFNEEIWKQNCKNIVYWGCYYKFSQNLNLKKKLIDTKDKILVETSAYDKIWRSGLNKYDTKRLVQSAWPGKNWLGECLMNVRNNLK